jgi:hypothetical protein
MAGVRPLPCLAWTIAALGNADCRTAGCPNRHVRGQTPAMSCQDTANGTGVADVFGIATRAIDENGDG